MSRYLFCRCWRSHGQMTIQPQLRRYSKQGSSSISQERIYILGVGNLGKFVAHGLSNLSPQPPVTLLLHRPGLVADWEACGRCIERIADGVGDKATGLDAELVGAEAPPAEQHEGAAKPIKNLVLATKTYMTPKALASIKDRLDKSSNIIFLQNGMGTTDEVSAAFFPDPASRPTYWAGICTTGIYSTTPFSFVLAGPGKMTIGPVSSSDESSLGTSYMVQSMLRAKDLVASPVSAAEIQRAQLLKLVVNAMANPLTAIFRCKNGDLFVHEARLHLMKALLEEAAPIIRALLPARYQGDDAFSDDRLLELVLDVTEKTAKNTTSMLQDIQAGRQTEIDYINGYIVRKGKDLGLPCSKNALLVDLVKQRRVIDNEGIRVFYSQ
ncbi:hypothetical protein VTK73DRAFT_3706 [Phialemonium thermophilum]|uniref:2-dehydropantoate 2-reductase n=1 Tax=Phialemonium thermophilum TaxID=223376 RepID=A0ABR3WXN6_9PEZI